MMEKRNLVSRLSVCVSLLWCRVESWAPDLMLDTMIVTMSHDLCWHMKLLHECSCFKCCMRYKHLFYIKEQETNKNC